MVNINNFNIKLLESYPCINIFGERKSGKTTLFARLMEFYKDYSYGFILTQDITLINYCKVKYPFISSFDNMDDILTSLQSYFKNIYDDKKCNTVIFLDDYMISKEDESILCNYIYYPKVKLIISSRVNPLLFPSFRSVNTCNFYLNFTSEGSHQLIYSSYPKLFINNSIYKSLYDHCTYNFSCMVITDDQIKKKINLYKYETDILKLGNSFHLQHEIKMLNDKMDNLTSFVIKLYSKIDELNSKKK